MDLKKFFPIYGTKLDGLKIFAMLFMLIDHINNIYFDSKVFEMFLIGRASFPLFAYALAASIIRVKNKGGDIYKYVSIMLIMGVISQPFYFIGFSNGVVNIFFTLAAGAVFTFNFDKFSNMIKHSLFIFAAIDGIFFYDAYDYGMIGVMLPVAMYLVLNGEYKYIFWLVVMLFGVNSIPIFSENNIVEGIAHAGEYSLLVASVMLIILTICFVLNYFIFEEKESRLLPKYALHVFYPLHILLLGVTQQFISYSNGKIVFLFPFT